MTGKPILEIDHLRVSFRIQDQYYAAVDDVSLTVNENEVVAIVGESGCGKTTTGRAIIGLIKATAGEILLEGTDLTKLSRRQFYPYRKDIQMIFQDPYSSLNPRKRVLDIIAEPIRNFEKLSPQEEKRKVQYFIERVGLNPESIYKYPHEFSGGQRQRIGIARALTLNPKLIIADEPVSALDVSVQAQVLNFMKEIQKEFQLTYLFISHDLGIIRHMCDRIGIMYRGRFVEEGTSKEIFQNPQHIYTKRLLSAIPNADPRQRKQQLKLREEVEREYKQSYHRYFDDEGKAYPLKKISKTHSVAIP